MQLTRRLALAAMIGCLGSAGIAQGLDLTGSYRALGRDTEGVAYTGAVQILQDGSNISINWEIGGQSYSGAGLLENGVVAVNWGDTSPVIYVVMPSGELHGTWANGTGLEKLIPQ